MYMQNRRRFTDIEKDLWLPKGKWKKGETNLEYGINRYKLLSNIYKQQEYTGWYSRIEPLFYKNYNL